MLYVSKYFKYTEKEAILLAKSNCIVNIGVDKIKLKEGNDNFNHPDLALAAFQHFLSWPEKRRIFLKKESTMSLNAFEAYAVTGQYEITENENIFFIP